MNKFVRLQKDTSDTEYTVGVYSVDDTKSENRLYTLEIDSQGFDGKLRLLTPDGVQLHEITMTSIYNLILTQTPLHTYVLVSVAELLRLVNLEAVFP